MKCAIGKKGIGNKKKEGDLITPIGLFKIKYILYRKDRVKVLTKLKKKVIKKNMGWCDDFKSSHYNKPVKLPFAHKYEKLYRKDHKYNFLIPISYNTKKIIPGKGSAIFIHLSKKYESTLGCIGLKQNDFLILIKLLKNTKESHLALLLL